MTCFCQLCAQAAKAEKCRADMHPNQLPYSRFCQHAAANTALLQCTCRTENVQTKRDLGAQGKLGVAWYALGLCTRHTSYNFKGTTSPRAQTIQNGLYTRNNSSVYLLAGECASHIGLMTAAGILLRSTRGSTAAFQWCSRRLTDIPMVATLAFTCSAEPQALGRSRLCSVVGGDHPLDQAAAQEAFAS